MYKEITREEAQVLHSLQIPFYYKYNGSIALWSFKWHWTTPKQTIYEFCVLEGEKICD